MVLVVLGFAISVWWTSIDIRFCQILVVDIL